MRDSSIRRTGPVVLRKGRGGLRRDGDRPALFRERRPAGAEVHGVAGGLSDAEIREVHRELERGRAPRGADAAAEREYRRAAGDLLGGSGVQEERDNGGGLPVIIGDTELHGVSQGRGSVINQTID